MYGCKFYNMSTKIGVYPTFIPKIQFYLVQTLHYLGNNCNFALALVCLVVLHTKGAVTIPNHI